MDECINPWTDWWMNAWCLAAWYLDAWMSVSLDTGWFMSGCCCVWLSSYFLPVWGLALGSFYLCLFPRQVAAVGVLTFDKGRLGAGRGRPPSTPTQKVARTMGFTTFSKIKLPWQLNGQPPVNAVAAAAFFSENVVKPMVLATLFLEML